ncbi:MAG: glutamate-5-semialdehyde dehydrogenase [Desulfovermiculus sp.]|nr:glutamate-5-semialdehyde dehydrogenase [Desulfovermiculus sp.]
MSDQDQIRNMAREVKQAATVLGGQSSRVKDAALQRLAELLDREQDHVLEANAQDLAKAQEMGLSGAMLDRLRLEAKTMQGMAQACREVAQLEDPVGNVEHMSKRPNGMLVGRMRIPLGVVAMIYESRPNVTVEAAILCLKAGNGCILRGGSEAFASNQALGGLISKALEESGLPGRAAQVVPTTNREAVDVLLGLDEYIDVVIPRGGEGLIRAVTQKAAMPVLKHYKGVCHIYVDETADLDQAVSIIHNAKVQRPGVCNALECLLVHKDMAGDLLPRVASSLGSSGVKFKADPEGLKYLGDKAQPALPTDFGYEFLDLTLAVRVVQDQDQAQEHIAAYGSGHTEAILTTRHDRAMRFVQQVDASLVAVNASTRFNDGGQLGLGAEIGISTSKLHAYGPMGVKELTSTKFVLLGQGQVRD